MKIKPGLFWVIAALIIGSVSCAGAATYYVCDHGATCGAGWGTGSDNNSASQAQSKTSPWKTIDKAEETVVGGDTVIVGDGVYSTGASEWSSVVVWVQANGNGSMITFKAENLHGAQLNGNGTMYGGIWFDTRYAGWVRFEDFEITNFNILGINSKDGDDAAPFARASRIEFYRLKIHHVGRIGITMQEVNDGLIDRCLIFDLTSTTAQHNQYHGIYISDNTDNIMIRNNVVYGTPEGWPIHIYDGHGRGPATNHSVIHNTLINESTHRDGGIVLYGSGHMVRNNLMWNAVDATGYSAAIYNSSLPSSVVISHNMTNLAVLCENSSTCGNATVGTNFLGTSFSGMFTNPSARDYSLQAGAQAIDAGYDGLADTDYAGNVRPQGGGSDIGAFESNSGPLTFLPPTNLRIVP